MFCKQRNYGFILKIVRTFDQIIYLHEHFNVINLIVLNCQVYLLFIPFFTKFVTRFLLDWI